MDIERAIHEPKIAELDVNEVVKGVTQSISMAYTLAGYRLPESKDLAVVSAKMASDIRESYSFLTLSEVALCFELGVKEEYGEFQGISVRTMTKWLKMYKQSDKRYKAITQANQTALPPPSEDYSKEAMHRMAERYFESYKETKEFGDMGIQVYQFLQKEGIINHSKEFKLKVMNEVDKLTDRRISPDIRNAKIINHAQVVCLKRFFDDLIELDMTIKEYEESKEF